MRNPGCSGPHRGSFPARGNPDFLGHKPKNISPDLVRSVLPSPMTRIGIDRNALRSQASRVSPEDSFGCRSPGPAGRRIDDYSGYADTAEACGRLRHARLHLRRYRLAALLEPANGRNRFGRQGARVRRHCQRRPDHDADPRGAERGSRLCHSSGIRTSWPPIRMPARRSTSAAEAFRATPRSPSSGRASTS